MKAGLVQELNCPGCLHALLLSRQTVGSDEEVIEGDLLCEKCGSRFPVTQSIPRFVGEDHYAQSFGFQWNQHVSTQVDTHSRTDISRLRFQNVTGWTNLYGEKVLEIGCGSGRFTQLALETGAEVYSTDASRAVDANFLNNGCHPSLHIIQADLYRLPLREGSFNRVLCLGVLQHCPDVKGAFLQLTRFLKPGGEIIVDVYDLGFRAFVNPKYWLRPLTRRLSHKTLYQVVKTIVPILYPIKQWISERIPVVGPYLAFLIPIAYHKGFVPGAERLGYEQLIEWSILDTFDKLSPAYDRPQRLKTIRRWFQDAGLTQINVRYGPNGIVGRGIQPVHEPSETATHDRISVAR